MDVILVPTSVFRIPSELRVGAIVHDGAADLRLWPGPGPDRELTEAWGDGLQQALDAELAMTGRAVLETGQCVRVHHGRLHCDFLCWVVSRPPEPGVARAPAPDRDALIRCIDAALAFVADKDVVRVAFPALGDGPGAIDAAERLALIADRAHVFDERRYAAGRAEVIEQVLICEPRSEVLSAARRRLGTTARTAPAPQRRVVEEPDSISEGPRTARHGAAPRASGHTSARHVRGRLDPAAFERMREASVPYDRTRRYAPGQWLRHDRFGIGHVDEVAPDGGTILVTFEDGERRRMLHGR
ncbi:MAG: hypothetical protein NZ898_15490 [Myxococcota bacterium]|nr:hypothetical protein [Myxococcota bacterium]MDW8364012.1 hypothetical protein [Myxococcales bacterium]